MSHFLITQSYLWTTTIFQQRPLFLGPWGSRYTTKYTGLIVSLKDIIQTDFYHFLFSEKIANFILDAMIENFNVQNLVLWCQSLMSTTRAQKCHCCFTIFKDLKIKHCLHISKFAEKSTHFVYICKNAEQSKFFPVFLFVNHLFFLPSKKFQKFQCHIILKIVFFKQKTFYFTSGRSYKTLFLR